jgi:DNA polymerase I-like protein with 3'-5' exonuclease and polymerase domains
VLLAYARYGSRQTLLKRIKDLWNGVDTPINLRFDSLVSTGRTSCIRGKTVAEGGATNGFQAQNVPRALGMRECFRPAPGEVIIAIDYSGMELCTWAQVCLWVLGKSDLAEALNNGLDPHLALGAEIIGLNYHDALTRKKEPEVKDARQTAKSANFGFMGGLGPSGFRAYSASTWGLVFSEARAVEIKQHWLTRWSEAEKYFAWIRAHKWVSRGDEKQRTTIKHLRSERIRGGCTYTEASNSYFQGLAADAAKAAGYALVRECELRDLRRWRVWNFVHDEVLIRGPEDDVDRALPLAQGVMEREAQLWVPDVRIRTEATVSRVWSKNAELIRGADGRIIPSM